MQLFFETRVTLDRPTYTFYNEIAKSVDRPVEDILSDMLYKYVDIIMKEIRKDKDAGQTTP